MPIPIPQVIRVLSPPVVDCPRLLWKMSNIAIVVYGELGVRSQSKGKPSHRNERVFLCGSPCQYCNSDEQCQHNEQHNGSYDGGHAFTQFQEGVESLLGYVIRGASDSVFRLDVGLFVSDEA